MHGTDVHSFDILNSGLGGLGDPQNNFCIMQGEFRQYSYRTEWCVHDQSCCLRRNPSARYAYPSQI